MSHGDCPVCFDELTDANYRIICANEHQLCETCFKEQVKPREAELDWGQAGTEYRVDIPTNCPVCRDPMLVWEDDLPEDQQEQSESEDELEFPDETDQPPAQVGVQVEPVLSILRRQFAHLEQQLTDTQPEMDELVRRITELRERRTSIAQHRSDMARRIYQLEHPEEQVQAPPQRPLWNGQRRHTQQPAQTQPVRRRRRGRRVQRCGNCGEAGHNRRSCPNQ